MSHESYCGHDWDSPFADDDQEHLFECDVDGCANSYEGRGKLSEVWEEAKCDGWRCFKNQSDKWEHRCPEHVMSS